MLEVNRYRSNMTLIVGTEYDPCIKVEESRQVAFCFGDSLDDGGPSQCPIPCLRPQPKSFIRGKQLYLHRRHPMAYELSSKLRQERKEFGNRDDCASRHQSVEALAQPRGNREVA